MLLEKFVHLDCHPVIPECGFRCAACVEEIRAVIGAISGVAAVSLAKHGDTSGIAVQFDPEAITIQDLLSAFRTLPSFYRGFFEPTVLEDWSGGSA